MNLYKLYRSAFLLGGAALGFGLLLLYLVGFLLNEINDLNAKKTGISTEVSTLNERLSILQTVSESSPQSAQVALNALPTDNNSLAVVSQLRAIATEKSITIKNLDLSTEAAVEGSNISGVVIGFDIEGEAKNVIEFIAELRHAMPIMTFESVNTQASGTSNIATSIINLRTRWSPLPEKLPAITEPIAGLSQTQQDLLNELSQYRVPQLVAVDASASGAVEGRVNPFTPAQ